MIFVNYDGTECGCVSPHVSLHTISCAITCSFIKLEAICTSSNKSYHYSREMDGFASENLAQKIIYILCNAIAD